jgi:hypothetical protein
MQKHQIGIVAGLVGLVLIGIIYGIFAFGGDEKPDSDVYNEQSKSNRLPTVPKTKTDEFTSKVDQAEDELKAKKDQEIEDNSRRKIDLDVFSSKKDNETTIPVEPEKTAAKTESKATKNNSATTVRKEPRKEEPVIDKAKDADNTKEEVDPDLIFASRSSKSSDPVTTDLPTSPGEEKFELHAVVHDQTVASQGTRITLRTTKELVYKGKTIPVNTFLTATTNFDNFRVNLTIPPVPCGDGSFISEKLTAYDGNDLVKGIYARELLENRGATNAAGDVIDDVNSEIPSRAARSIVRNIPKGKVKEVTVTLRNNHPVIIKK